MVYAWLCISTYPGLGLSQSSAQFLILPLVLLAFFKMKILGGRLPRMSIVLAGVAAVTAGLIGNYAYVADDKGALLVATLVGDDIEAESRVFREEIRKSLTANESKLIQRYPKKIVSNIEAQKTLNDINGALGVVWGNQRWLNVQLPQASIVTLHQLALPTPPVGLPDLHLVKTVQIFGLSYNPEGASANFLGNFARALSAIRLYESSQSIEDLDRAIDELEATVRIVARWTSYAHRGAVAWMLGNRHLERALKIGGARAKEDIRLAERAFGSARGFVPSNQAPEFEAAILNNQALALIVRGSIEERSRGVVRRARKLLVSATKLSKSEIEPNNSEEIRSAVRFNLKVLKELKRGKRMTRVAKGKGSKRAKLRRAKKHRGKSASSLQ